MQNIAWKLGFRQKENSQILSKTTACFRGLKGSHRKLLDEFCAALSGRNIFWGDCVPRVADCVLTLGCHVLPFQGDSAAVLNAVIISNATVI
jgi:hypothetical protein